MKVTVGILRPCTAQLVASKGKIIFQRHLSLVVRRRKTKKTSSCVHRESLVFWKEGLCSFVVLGINHFCFRCCFCCGCCCFCCGCCFFVVAAVFSAVAVDIVVVAVLPLLFSFGATFCLKLFLVPSCIRDSTWTRTASTPVVGYSSEVPSH